jgi:hypothetical protein
MVVPQQLFRVLLFLLSGSLLWSFTHGQQTDNSNSSNNEMYSPLTMLGESPEGDPACPCLSLLETLLTENLKLTSTARTSSIDFNTKDINPATFGVGCALHANTTNQCSSIDDYRKQVRLNHWIATSLFANEAFVLSRNATVLWIVPVVRTFEDFTNRMRRAMIWIDSRLKKD